MNIVLEGDINFYDELHNLDSDEEDENEELCLITNSALDNNHIVLPCQHKFNFIPLYKEVLNQKLASVTSHLNIDKLLINEIKCPYCRQKTTKLLPHVKLHNEMGYYVGVNSPEEYCMPFHICSYIFKSGKNKNKNCNKTGLYKEDNCYCSQHHNTKHKQTKLSNELITCKAILKSGKRKDMECGSKVTDGQFWCKRHLPK